LLGNLSLVLDTETLGTVHAVAEAMTDVALSILALIAGGLTLELFAGAPVRPGFHHERGTLPDNPFPEPLEDFPAGNPS